MTSASGNRPPQEPDGSPEIREGESGQAGSSPPSALKALEIRVAEQTVALDQAKSREDLLRMQLEETRLKAGQAMAFQVEIAEQQRAALEELNHREQALQKQLDEIRQKAELATELEAELGRQREDLEQTRKTSEKLAALLEEAQVENAIAQSYQTEVLELREREIKLKAEVEASRAAVDAALAAQRELEARLDEGRTEHPAAAELQDELERQREAYEVLRRREEAAAIELSALQPAQRDPARTKQRAALRWAWASRIWAMQLQAELERKESSLDVLARREQELAAALDAARYQVSLAHSLHEDWSAKAAAAEELRETVEGLEERLAAAERSASRVPALEAEIASGHVEVDGLRQRVFELTGLLETARHEAGEEKNRLEAEWNASRVALDSLETRLAQSEGDLERFRSEAELADRLREDLAAAHRTLEETSNRVVDLEARLADREAQARRVADLEAELARERSELQALRESEVELRRDLDDARKRAADSEALRSENGRQFATIEELRRRETRLRSELESARAAAAVVERLRAQLASESAAYQSLRQRESELAARLRAAAETASSGEAEALRRELQRAHEALAGAAEKENEMRKALEAARHEAARAVGLEQELNRHRELVIELRRRERELQGRLEKAADQNELAQALRAEVQSRNAELERKAEREKTLEADLASAREEARVARELSLELAAQRAALEELRRVEETLRAELEAARREAAVADALRARLTERESALEDLRRTEAELRSRIEASPAQAAGPLQAELDVHHAALADAKAQNQRLSDQLEEATRLLRAQARPGRRRLLAGAAFVVVAAVVAVLGVRFYPFEDEARKSAEVLDKIKQQNAALASELNSTLARLQEAKETELSLDRHRGLSDRLAAAEQRAGELERESPVNLARITQLQSDLDLANAKLARLFTELSNRDLKIMELEMLLNEAGAEAFQMNLPPAFSLDVPALSAFVPPIGNPSDSAAPSQPVPPTGSVAESLQATQAKAEQAYQDKNYALAEILFQRVADAASSNALALSNLAAVQLELGKLTAAEKNIREAIQINPDDAFARTTLGIIQIRTGAVNAAVQTLLDAIALDATDPASFNYLGVAFGQLGQRQRAMEEIGKALKLSPDYAEAHFNLAVLGAEGTLEEREKAAYHYRRALELGARPDSLLENQMR